ncbi:MAG: protein BatD [Saprospiraceae bacterium]|nr:protein BatD [Saprospiraceae bacterium]
MKRLQILLLLGFVSVTLFAQKEVSFTASTNALKVVKGGVFQVVFSIKEVNVQDFEAPNLRNFDIVAGPDMKSSRTIVNGEISMATTYSYYLKAKKLVV